MAYQKQTWEDYPSLSSPITADRLNHIENGIEDASSSIFPSDKYTILSGDLTMTDGEGTTTISYPTGYTKNNTFILSVMTGNATNPSISYSYGTIPDISGVATGAIYKRVSLGTDNIILGVYNHTASGSGTINYKILLVRID